MTPLHLSILIHYFSCGGDYEEVITNETRRNYAFDLAKAGLLYTPPKDHNQFFEITDYGKKKFEECLAAIADKVFS